MSARIAWGALLVLTICARSFGDAIFASSVEDYTQGNASVNNAPWNDPTAALGAPNPDTGFGALNPFNPAFATTDIVIVNPGGQLDLEFSQAVKITPGPQLGVFANNGIIDVSSGGTGVAGNPAELFDGPPEADVSISPDGVNWTAVGNETFPLPTNAYLDTEISDYFQPD
jgi:hypothetical protein